jgi:Coenzyme PQQ synthesis protein D (PqqD)
MGDDYMSDRYIRHAPKLAARRVAGEMVILNADDSSLYVLNELGTAIWEAANGQTSLQTIVDTICRDYDVDRAVAEQDVDGFVTDLVHHGVLQTSDVPVTSEGASSQVVR